MWQVITGTLAAFGIEQWEIYSQSKVPVVIVNVKPPVLGLFYLSMIYNILKLQVLPFAVKYNVNYVTTFNTLVFGLAIYGKI